MAKSVRLLVHCNLNVLKIGFDLFVKNLSLNIKTSYKNLNTAGVLRRYLTNEYDFIVLLPSNMDEDYDLCRKINLYIPQIPIIYINHYIPSNYKIYLQKNNVVIIMESPFTCEYLEEKIREQLNNK